MKFQATFRQPDVEVYYWDGSEETFIDLCKFLYGDHWQMSPNKTLAAYVSTARTTGMYIKPSSPMMSPNRFAVKHHGEITVYLPEEFHKQFSMQMDSVEPQIPKLTYWDKSPWDMSPEERKELAERLNNPKPFYSPYVDADTWNAQWLQNPQTLDGSDQQQLDALREKIVPPFAEQMLNTLKDESMAPSERVRAASMLMEITSYQPLPEPNQTNGDEPNDE